MNQKLTGAYRYTYKAIKKELKLNVVRDKKYKETLSDLFNIFLQLQLSQSSLPAEFLDSKTYAKSLEDGLNIKRHPVLIKSIIISSYAILSFLFIFFFLIGFIIRLLPSLHTPVIYLEENVVSWEKIDGADYYVVSINNEEFTTTNTSYEFTPTQYGATTLTVEARSHNIFNKGSARSTELKYNVEESIKHVQDYPHNNAVPLTTDELGNATLITRLLTSGYHNISFHELEDAETLSLTISDMNDVLIEFSGDENIEFYFNAYDIFSITINYKKYTDVTLLILPINLNLNQSFTIPAQRQQSFNLNYNVNLDQYVALVNYHHSIVISDNYFDPFANGLPPGRVVWMTDSVRVSNGTIVNQEVKLIVKTVSQLLVNKDYSIDEINQVQIFKVTKYQFPIDHMLYVEYESDFYDIYFMDDQQRKVHYHEYLGERQKISIPLFSALNLEAVYFIFVPKIEKFTGETYLRIHTTMPEHTLFWPNNS